MTADAPKKILFNRLRLNEQRTPPTGAKEGADLWATVMVGADRLYVKPKAGYQLKGLPEVFMGFPVERIAELAS